MDIVNSIVKYLTDFAVTSEATYHVNPWIFCILFFGSAIPLYYGYYRIGKSTLKFEDRKLKRKQIDRKELKIGIIISVIAWWIPYLYVIAFGRLPWNYWLLFFLFVAIMGVFFVKALLGKIKNTRNEDND